MSHISDDFEGPVPPPTARAGTSQDIGSAELSSRVLSPTGTSNLSKVVSNDDKVQADFENGGIRLKKRPSVNFGAPLGQMSSFANARKLS